MAVWIRFRIKPQKRKPKTYPIIYF